MFGKARFIFLLILISLLVVACGQGEETAEEATAVPPTATAELIVIATPVPTAEATIEAAEPAEAPTAAAEHSEEHTAAAVAQPAGPRLGLLRFRDNNEFLSGEFQLLMENVEPSPPGTHYELWLTNEQGVPARKLGAFQAASNVQFTGGTEEHLLGTYSGALISIEPDGIEDGEVGTLAFTGSVPAGSLLHIRHVVFQFPANPDGKGFLIGADEQMLLATEHGGLLQGEVAAGNLGEARRHAEHVINILDGETGATFGDLDGDGVVQNPGDGFGVRNYFIGAQEHAQLAADAEGATEEVKLHASHVIVSGDNALLWLDEAIQTAVRVLSSDSVAEAQPAADELVQQLTTIVNGVDANNDGAVAPIEGEGGLLTAYEHALNMGSFEIFAGGDGVTAAAAPPAADEPAEAQPTTEAQPTAEAPAAAGVTVDMANFAYQSNNITVPVGTTVTWVNKDEVRHSATAADGTFDTGLFDPNGQASVTFDTPGTYLYYCLLHGEPDGNGMVGTITVGE